MMGNINQVNPIKLLVINDSTIFREMIRSLFIPYRDVKMIASAPNPVMGIEKIKQERPDVILLDIEMSRMDGLSFLQEMKKNANPIPCVVCSTMVNDGSPDALRAKDIVVGASTGGTEALKDFLNMLPEDTPGMVIVQHMPEHFTAAFANRLDVLCKIHVKEAQNGDAVIQGQALIAPGNYHTLLKRSGSRYYVEIKEGPLVSRHRPSVDVLFRSAARYAGKNAIGIIMTGMGDDGAKGMREMHDSGAFTIAQDEASCIVYGMPGEAVKNGGVDKIVPLSDIAQTMINASLLRTKQLNYHL